MILYEYLPSNILCMLVCVSMKAEDVEAPNSACTASQPIPNQKIDGHEWIMIRLSLLDVLVASFGEDSFVFKERVKWPVLIPAEVYCTKCYSGNECAWTCWHMFEMNVSLVSLRHSEVAIPRENVRLKVLKSHIIFENKDALFSHQVCWSFIHSATESINLQYLLVPIPSHQYRAISLSISLFNSLDQLSPSKKTCFKNTISCQVARFRWSLCQSRDPQETRNTYSHGTLTCL